VEGDDRALAERADLLVSEIVERLQLLGEKVKRGQGEINCAAFRPDQQGGGDGAVLHAHGDVPVAGTFTDTYTGGLFSAATVAFETIPEPSTTGLLGLGLLALLRRTRKG